MNPTVRTASVFVRLRWKLWRGAVRHGGAEQFGAIASTVASALIGVGGGIAIAVSGREVSDPSTFAVLFCTLVVIAALGFGIVAGISQPVDPRVIAAEPLPNSDRSVGLLAAAAFGPPGLAGITIGIGLLVGMTDRLSRLPVNALAVASWLFALLLVARTVTNLLALFTSRYPRLGQLIVGLGGLGFYAVFQIVPATLNRLDDDGRQELADGLAWTPTGQLGRSLAGDGMPWLHAVAGSLWLPVLAVAFAWSTTRLSLSVRRSGGVNGAAMGPFRRMVRRVCGTGAVGALAWRSLLLRFRNPRTALETFIGAGVGLGAVLVPVLVRDGAGSEAVLIGGAVQLAVLFMAGNSFGTDGPALTHELLTGVPTRVVVVAKVRSIAIIGSALAVTGPVIAAGFTGEWRFLPAGIGVGIGGLLAGAGAAVVQAAYVPIAIPETDNPFASGESGKGIVAALLLVGVLFALTIVTVPVALALIWATDRGNVALVTVLGVATIGIGLLVAVAGIRLATRRIDQRQPEFVAAVTPAR